MTIEQPQDDPVISVDADGSIHALREGEAVVVGSFDGIEAKVRVHVYGQRNLPAYYPRPRKK